MSATAALDVHPDRLLPADPSQRSVARRLYDSVKELPIISPHGHVPPQWIAEDIPFRDPTSLLITPDHYVNRMLHAHGASLADLGVGRGPLSEDDARAAFRILCSNWSAYRGTPVRYWLEDELGLIFGVTQRPSAETADAIYDQIAAKIATPQFRPRALMDAFDIAVMATTDDPCDDLSAHEALAQDASFTRRVVPTFRPDKYLDPALATWTADVDRLGEVSGVGTGDYAGYIGALENRRRYFVDHGAVSADHGVIDARTDILSEAEASRIFAAARAGSATAEETTAFRRHMLSEMARMSCDDGLVMTIHPGVRRNHHTPTHQTYGADVGCDIPIAVEYTDALRPLLNAYGTHPNLHLVLFTIDETVYSRELAPLAGFYPSVYVGVPWWFIDAPEAIQRFRSAVTETAGFSRTSGFIDDTRAFCSIPARHDMSRRLDAGYIAKLVTEHRLPEDEAFEAITDLVANNPRKVFKL
ncbi:glucuronate isomerase [Occultella glacieicola]|uniref:Uronate isomerase n=1 Tax=Occultella glacieicola TaxID=2518684 RepID=A0ABY2DYQ1_9MICO|nr:glucuronate isomerase [Occultella glacieicola]TDE89614.1 glucuronate isomerase [Occultella glacieicola]